MIDLPIVILSASILILRLFYISAMNVMGIWGGLHGLSQFLLKDWLFQNNNFISSFRSLDLYLFSSVFFDLVLRILKFKSPS